MQSRVFLAALGVALLAGCATPKPPPPVAVVPPPPPRPTLTQAQPGPWRITKTEWSKADEDGFGEFLREIAESGCTTTVACMQSAANFYHDSDPPTFLFHADCAKWAYMLRAYYASKNGLPFSYVDKINGDVVADLRYAQTPNLALERHDIVDTGTGIDAVAELQALHDKVWTATYRMDPSAETPVEQDFYSPKIQPGSIRPGTAIYDTTGHVMLVYEVTSDGSILYMDAHPDESVSRGTYGPQVPMSGMVLGGGFKNFRPLKLVGATLRADGSYIGGTIVLAQNSEIPDYSLEQYRGNVADAQNSVADPKTKAAAPQVGAADAKANAAGAVAVTYAASADPSPQFRYNNASLNLYEYTRAAMSKGGFAFNPVYEIQVTMGSLCSDAKAGTRDAKARVQSGLAALDADLSKISDEWRQRDLRVVFHGTSLKDTLAQTYTAGEQSCVVAASNGNQTGDNPLEALVLRSPQYDAQRVISGIYDPSYVGMQPVGN